MSDFFDLSTRNRFAPFGPLAGKTTARRGLRRRKGRRSLEGHAAKGLDQAARWRRSGRYSPRQRLRSESLRRTTEPLCRLAHQEEADGAPRPPQPACGFRRQRQLVDVDRQDDRGAVSPPAAIRGWRRSAKRWRPSSRSNSRATSFFTTSRWGCSTSAGTWAAPFLRLGTGRPLARRPHRLPRQRVSRAGHVRRPPLRDAHGGPGEPRFPHQALRTFRRQDRLRARSLGRLRFPGPGVQPLAGGVGQSKLEPAAPQLHRRSKSTIPIATDFPASSRNLTPGSTPSTRGRSACPNSL